MISAQSKLLVFVIALFGIALALNIVQHSWLEVSNAKVASLSAEIEIQNQYFIEYQKKQQQEQAELKAVHVKLDHERAIALKQEKELKYDVPKNCEQAIDFLSAQGRLISETY